MFARKLSSLQYEQQFNIEGKMMIISLEAVMLLQANAKCLHFFLADETSFRNLVFWLENIKIRFYAPESRDELVVGATNWNAGLEKVCQATQILSCNNEIFIVVFA